MRRLGLALLLAILFLSPVRAGDDEKDAERDFRRRVDAAITKGCKYLGRIQRDDGTWQTAYDDKYPGGGTSLCLLALLLSEWNIWSDEVQAALKWVEKQKFDRTYSAAVAMMAIEARYIPPDEWKAMREGKPIKKFVRKLTPEHKAFMKHHVDMLLNGRQHEAWGYPKGPEFSGDWRGDMSNTQYAVLGLKSASRGGVRIEEKEWMRILRVVLQAQVKKGEKVRLVVNRTVDKKGYSNVETRVAEARGWRYHWPVSMKSGTRTVTQPVPPNDKPSGSMTTGAISCLAIIHSELYRSRKYRSKMKDVARAMDDGFAWLQENYAVENNPGRGKLWHFYYLYGLERAGVLADRRWIGKHDWYREGAEYLLGRQQGTGSWGGVIDTCFALLFLKRSTTPVTISGLHPR